MAPATSFPTSEDVPQRIKHIRGVRGLTQAQLAEAIGVSFASVNRWESGQTCPNNLAWQKILGFERLIANEVAPLTPSPQPASSLGIDFSADPSIVSAVAEAHRLSYGHLFNKGFATETSLIDPLPHQRIAVYSHMLGQSPLRFLLADDAGAGKTIMTGLYVREMLSRRLIRRVLVVSPAGLVGNWKREMRILFRLQFRIVVGTDARLENPFEGSGSDLVIVSLDTLAGERMFKRLQESTTTPYDLVVFDEAHKLSASRGSDYRVRKTDRYELAEALAGAGTDSKRWQLQWFAPHLLLLTATPHMGKDSPYYFLWRLLLPQTLTTQEAFDDFPPRERKMHFIRRTKEEMIRFDGNPLYPQRNCDTLSYELNQGPGGEQDLYDETTEYIRSYYSRSQTLNRSAAHLAMGVFQRRLASSTYALLCSFQRRKEKIEALIEKLQDGKITKEWLVQRQRNLGRLEDPFETQTADEDAILDGEDETHESFDSRVMEATSATNSEELKTELRKVEELSLKARVLFESGEESKFAKLREVLQSPKYVNEKLIIFTEHRDTAYFLMRRLEGLGFTDQIAMIHGGMTYQERERQVELFRGGGGVSHCNRCGGRGH